MHILMRRLGKDAATLAHVSFVEVDDKDVCWLRVEPTPKPAYVEDEGDVKFYVRIGNTTQPMNAKELTDYVPKRWA
jgi:predicted HTH transcriptional regulator